MKSDENEIELIYECDVLVIGSGVSGYCAAIQSGRCGYKTILLEKDAVLGGNSGPDLGVGITGADRYNPYGTETGIIQELQEDAAWANAFTNISSGTMPYSISRRNEAVVQEHLEMAGVQILKRHLAKKPVMEGDRIVEVLAEDLAAFCSVKIKVNYMVVEASGDGHIGALAGADFDMGSESRDEFNERSAPMERTKLVQGTSLVAIAHRTDHEVAFIPPREISADFPPRLWHSSMSGFIHHHDGWFSDRINLKFLYITETGGHLDTIKDDAKIYEMLLRQLWSEWDHIKNGPHKDQAKCWDLLWVSPKAGKRESRRFLGDYILTQIDLEDGRFFYDDIAYGGHDLDDHQPLREGSNIFAHSIPPMYGIPYRCCYSRNIKNLFIAGRLISATHLAHSSSRVMRTGAAIGQAVGMAAALCCKYRCDPVDILRDRLDELQQSLLMVDSTILSKPLQDNLDLARKAIATATSEIKFNHQEPGQMIPLIGDAAVILWDWQEYLNSLELFLKNISSEHQKININFFRAKREPKWKNHEDFQAYGWNDLREFAFRQIGTIDAILPSNYEGWYRVDFPEPLKIGKKDPNSDEDRLLIALKENPYISWAITKKNEIGEMLEHSHHRPVWKPLGVMGTLRLYPAPKLGEGENVINGFHRRFSRGPTNMWISDVDDGLPQDLVLSWPEAWEFNQVNITFDNLPQYRHDNPWESGKRILDICIKEYELAIWEGNNWRLIAKEDCNYHRFRTHSFETLRTNRLRLRIINTHGSKQVARVYQISVYKNN